MNKEGELDYIVLIANAIRKSYGNTIVEYDTDLDLAKDILKELQEYLCFHPMDMTTEEFKEWRKEVYEEVFDGLLKEDIEKKVKKLNPDKYKIFEKKKKKSSVK